MAPPVSPCLCTEKHTDTLSLDGDASLRNEGGLRKTNPNELWVGKERHVHNYLLNLDSFGGTGEAEGRKCMSRA